MTKKERLYLRSAYHHFETLQSTSLSELIHNGSAFSRFVVDSRLFHKLVGLVLSLEGDIDGEIEPELQELLEDNQMPLHD